MLDASLVEKLGNVLGPKGLVTDSNDIAPWLTDWRKLYVGRAAALLAPANVGKKAFSVVGVRGLLSVSSSGDSDSFEN